EYFLSKRLSSSDIIELANRFATDVKHAGISIIPKPPMRPDQFMIDEEKLEEAIGPYYNPRALQHDVVSVASIYRLRQGQEKFELENCTAIFVTNNPRLARNVFKYFEREFDQESVALVMDDQTLTNIVWLKNPNEVPNVAKSR